MILAPLRAEHVEPLAGVFGRAFAEDPVMYHFFEKSSAGVQASAEQFFSLLLRVRIATGAPAIVASVDGTPVGCAMGYATAGSHWPPEFEQEWSVFEANIDELPERLAEYEALSNRYHPAEPHFYLGAIAVDPSHQGRGIGRTLVEEFRNLSMAEEESSGVYLETANPDAKRAYIAWGYQELGCGPIRTGTLWCMFQPRHLS